MNKLQTILNDEIDRRTEINRSGMKINWDERSDLPSQFMGTKMTETRSDAYGYNARSELTNAVKNATLNEYAYQYDNIGNRETAFERGTNFTYEANNLNQYTTVGRGLRAAPLEDVFSPAYDLDGNQTLVQTKTGIWSVTYNGENRPVLWTCGATNIVMKFDRMGRRVEYIESVASSNSSFIIQHSKFVYDGYLCIQRLNGSNNSITELFEWDPTEKVATRPMFMQYRVPGQTYALFYTHDGNKNVSEVVHFSRANGVAAHYEYAPFGEVTAQVRQGGITAYDFAALNPWRFSSEYADDASATVYYNYRHYEPMTGRWLQRDPEGELSMVNNYGMCLNRLPYFYDALGLKVFWSSRDLDSFFWGNHHFITFAYDSREEAPAIIRNELMQVSCKNCKTKYVMFIGLERRIKEDFVAVKRFWSKTKVVKKKKRAIIRLYKLSSDSDLKIREEHGGDLKSFKEELCGEKGFFSDLDYQGNEISGYGDEVTFVEKLMELYKTSEAYFESHDIEYRLLDQNCATWVNGILKAAGISEGMREANGEFDGFDWGEESDNLEDSFRNHNK